MLVLVDKVGERGGDVEFMRVGRGSGLLLGQNGLATKLKVLLKQKKRHMFYNQYMYILPEIHIHLSTRMHYLDMNDAISVM